MTQLPKPVRKSPRMPGYDYGSDGVYFVTICTHQRLWRFGKVINDEMVFSDTGQIAAACMVGVPDHFPAVQVDGFVVMPNHVHALLVIEQHEAGARRHDARRAIVAPFTSPPADSLSRVVASYKAAVTRLARRLAPRYADLLLWQRSYHEHVVRNQSAYHTIRQYIAENPARWHQDVHHTTG